MFIYIYTLLSIAKRQLPMSVNVRVIVEHLRSPRLHKSKQSPLNRLEEEDIPEINESNNVMSVSAFLK